MNTFLVFILGATQVGGTGAVARPGVAPRMHQASSVSLSLHVINFRPRFLSINVEKSTPDPAEL